MSETKNYVDGVRLWERKDNQPDFVLGSLCITPEDLIAWMSENKDSTSDYKGKRQVKFQLKKSKQGKIFLELDTWKPSAGTARAEKSVVNTDDDMPF